MRECDATQKSHTRVRVGIHICEYKLYIGLYTSYKLIWRGARRGAVVVQVGAGEKTFDSDVVITAAGGGGGGDRL